MKLTQDCLEFMEKYLEPFTARIVETHNKKDIAYVSASYPNTIFVCEENIRTPEGYDLTFVHELAHLVQLKKERYFCTEDKEAVALFNDIQSIMNKREDYKTKGYSKSPMECDAVIASLYYVFELFIARTITSHRYLNIVIAFLESKEKHMIDIIIAVMKKDGKFNIDFYETIDMAYKEIKKEEQLLA